jgi:hypothetical protein
VLIVTLSGSGGSTSPARASGPFAWLHPQSPPAGWKIARTPGGSTVAYPPGWRPIKTDPGTATVALLGSDDRIDGYINETPRQGAETLADWSSFRPHHNGDEGDRAVRVEAAARDVQFGSGRASCVIDTYSTSIADYREIACLIVDSRASAVVVATAPTALWPRQAPTLERAVTTFRP